MIAIPTKFQLRSFITLCLSLTCISALSSEYSPPVNNTQPSQVFWGDTHLHTNLSPDAFTFGNQGMGPDKAYRFARGEMVTSQSGVKAKLARPLDFLMVSDHSEFLGIFPRVFGRSPDIINTPLGKRWIKHIEAGKPENVLMEFGLMSMGALNSDNQDAILGQTDDIDAAFLEALKDVRVPPELQQSIWEQVGAVADAYNEPGRFTAFIGYEYTSMPDGNNLHRNVLFRDDAKTTSQVVPFSSMDSGNPEDLWKFMAAYEEKTGGAVLAIPHNGNTSNGLMFTETTYAGKPLTKEQAETRLRWEPIIEATQIKGDGEAHPFLSPNDEFADYETWDKGNLSLTFPKSDDMLKYEYARSALRVGLEIEQEIGTNPYRFGMIGSTDAHTSLATADEDNFFGKMTSAEPFKDRAKQDYFPVQNGSQIELKHWESLASGYAAVWATENTRAAIFDAMRRKETYATTGPRMTVRFFGGWQFEEGDTNRPDAAQHGYRKGVPMGGEISGGVDDDAPSFMVWALKDPIGANLDRIQIVKGWVDEQGESYEMVYNVAASDGRKIRRNKVKPVGNTVDVDNASFDNSIGDPLLGAVWQDPDFNADQNAFYYVRVLEIPTPRWSTYDAEHFNSDLPEKAPPFGQERAYTSPIWYTP